MSLLKALSRNAKERTNQAARIYLDEDGRVVFQESHAQFAARVSSLVRHLRENVSPRAVVLLVCDAGPDFPAAFFACMATGLTTVPLPPLEPSRCRTQCPYLSSLIAETDAQAILSAGSALADLRRHLPHIAPSGVACLDINAQSEGLAPSDLADPDAERQVALLFTSGSTSAPKGVIIRHRHLVYNGETCCRAWRIGERSVMVSWMPNHHSFGLIYNVVLPLVSGATIVSMAPAAFLRDPALWLRTLSRYKASHGAAATFGYQYCAERVDPHTLTEVELRHWAVGLVSAEPIRRGVYDRFLERFRCLGLRSDFFCALYGLSETGPIISMPVQTPPQFHMAGKSATELDLACVGGPFPRTRLRCIRPGDRAPCAEGESGEIWLAGPSVMDGYFGDEGQKGESFAPLPGDEEVYFRTGDLGFVREGNVFITGRLKETIIVRGKKFYPQDIEWLAKSAHPATKHADVAAFTHGETTDPRIVVVIAADLHATHEDPWDPMSRAIGSFIGTRLGLRLHELVWVPAGAIPKTASGKLKRHACRRMLLEGAMSVTHRTKLAAGSEKPNQPLPSGRPTVEALRALFAEKLGLPLAQVDAAQPLSRFQLDSALYLELAAAIERDLGATLHPTAFFKAGTLAGLADLIDPADIKR